MEFNITGLFNNSISTVAYNLQNNECLEVGNKYIIDSIPEFKFAVFKLLFEFILIVTIIRYASSILSIIYEMIFKKKLMISYPEWEYKRIKNNLGFYTSQVDLFEKVSYLCGLLIEFRIIFAIQYIIF